MKQELLHQLISRFPWVVDSMYPLYINGYCKIEVNDGWFTLIWSMFTEFDEIYKSKPYHALIIRQVKEKFGVLTVYVYTDIPDIDDLIKKYEELSKSTCYDCGGEGYLQLVNGRKTLCNDCGKKRMVDLHRKYFER